MQSGSFVSGCVDAFARADVCSCSGGTDLPLRAFGMDLSHRIDIRADQADSFADFVANT